MLHYMWMVTQHISSYKIFSYFRWDYVVWSIPQLLVEPQCGKILIVKADKITITFNLTLQMW